MVCVSDSSVKYLTAAQVVPDSLRPHRLSRLLKYWSEVPFPTPGDLPDPGIESASLASPVLASRIFATALLLSAKYGCHFLNLPY